MQNNTVPQELETQIRVHGKIDIIAAGIVVVTFLLSFLTMGMITPAFQIVYIVFETATAIVLVLPSPGNPKRRIAHTLLYVLFKDRGIYRPLITDKENTDEPT
jgi:hypothetical protein